MMVDIAADANTTGRLTLAADTETVVRFPYDMRVTRIVAPATNSAGGVWWTDDDTTPAVDESNWLPAGHAEEFEPQRLDGDWPVTIRLLSETAGDVVLVQKAPGPLL